MEAILDLSQDFNVSLLDKIVTTFYTGSGSDRQIAQTILTQFEELPDAWTKVPEILESSTYPQTKYIGLQILESLITKRWRSLPESQRQGIRNFLINITVRLTSDETTLRKERFFINKLNLALVQVLKQEWPHNWPTFISELVESSKTNLSLCENNMIILKLLSEEVFDYSADQMTQGKIRNLKAQMSSEISEIFKLCSEVLHEAVKPSLLTATLETLLKYLSWIPHGYVFETDIIDVLSNRFLKASAFRNVTLSCFAEIATIPVPSEYGPKVVAVFMQVMAVVSRIIPPDTNIAKAYDEAGEAGQEFILNLAIFLANFLTNHLAVLERSIDKDLLVTAHIYLVKVSAVDEREIFRICMEYWMTLLAGLYNEISNLPVGSLAISLASAGALQSALVGGPLRKDIYAQVLTDLRLVVIQRMVKPEEVLIVENDEGEIVREILKETDTITLYKAMRELLVYLTHLDVNDTQAILLNKLSRQVDKSEWSWNNLNTLCWAIGSISGAMSEEMEKGFLVTVIKDLLALVEQTSGKDNKAVIAANIMYIVGQYPRFLKAHWKFLKTVVNKLFEFMHESHEGVQDMACDTFIKVAKKCRRHFIVQQQGEREPFVDEILRNMGRITIDLSPQQVHTFYEAVGYMISAQPNKPMQEKLIMELMQLPNAAWDTLMAQASQSTDVLSNHDNVKVLSNILRTNIAACTSIGALFFPQVGRIFMDMMGLYKAVSNIISDAIAKDGPIASRRSDIRGLRAVKKDILRLMEIFIKRVEDLQLISSSLILPLLDAVLGDYGRNHPSSRDAEALNLVEVMVQQLKTIVTPQAGAILETVLEPTLSMITQDFTEYPEHRLPLFRLLKAINLYCFPALLQLSPEQFSMYMNSVFWATKHLQRDIADTGLNMCLEIMEKFSSSQNEVAGPFFQQYLLTILQETFYVLTDANHKSGFPLQALILSKIFQMACTDSIPIKIFDASQVSDPNMSNQEFLRTYTAKLLSEAFPHLQKLQVEYFIVNLTTHHSDLNLFKSNLRDFLIRLKEFSGEDNSDLFLEEREQETALKEAQQRATAEAVPGFLKPSQLPDEM